METDRDISREILLALTASGLRPISDETGPFTEIRVSPPAAADAPDRAVSFIVMDNFAGTPEEAVRLSDLMSARLNSLREDGAKAMVVPADIWLRRRDMTLGRMLAHCGIFSRVFARNCEVRRIRKPETDAFMNLWHSYGTAVCRNRYGLFTVRETVLSPDVPDLPHSMETIPAGTLVAAAEFSNMRRRTVDGRAVRSYEWVRYASLPNLRVDGGMGKILRKFVDEVHPDDVMSYADLEWSDGGVYRTLGFREDGRKPPVLFAVDPTSMSRIPLTGSRRVFTSPQYAQGLPEDRQVLYYSNFGSVRYRLPILWNQAR